MAFTTPSYSLSDLFSRVNNGELQLPDFQRRYAWDIDHIRSLVVTVLRGYPIGALLALDTRNQPMRFRPRSVDGAPAARQDPGLLLLDGQQRLTSLYNCFHGSGLIDTVDFRSKRITRQLFVDVAKAVEREVMPDEAVFAVDSSGHVTSHFGPDLDYPLVTREDAVRAGCVPVVALLGDAGSALLFEMAAAAEPETLDKITAFNYRIATPLSGYAVPMIRLGRETARAGVGPIFAQANSLGLQMDVFELLTAVFVTEDPEFSLTRDWEATQVLFARHPVLGGIDRTGFLTAVSLLVTARRGKAAGQREDILQLSLADYRGAADQLRAGFCEAADFLSQRRILTTEQVPNTAQIIPLAVILTLLDETPGALDTTRGMDRVNQWFWCGVFGELYGSSAVSLRASRDVDAVTDWVRRHDAAPPKTVEDAAFAESRLLSIAEDSGVWKGIYALLLGRGARDWRTGRVFGTQTNAEVEFGFHRIFPRVWCVDNDIDLVLSDSVLNRTPMSKRAEVILDGYDPGRYLVRVQSKSLMENEEFEEVLASHELDPALLRASEPGEFFADRRRRLVSVVEEAMGKVAIHDVDDGNYGGGVEGPDAFAD